MNCAFLLLKTLGVLVVIVGLIGIMVNLAARQVDRKKYTEQVFIDGWEPKKDKKTCRK